MTAENESTTMETWLRVTASYITQAALQLREEGLLRQMQVETTITDVDGTRTIARVEVDDPQDEEAHVTTSSELKSLSQGELLLAVASALALYTESASALSNGAPETDGDDSKQED